MGRFLCLTLSTTLVSVDLAASLQEHVEGVHHAFAQVGGAAGRQQGAEFKGFGDTVLVDVRQHVLIPLATQNDLGVVVVKVDLWRLKEKRFISLFSIIFWQRQSYLILPNPTPLLCN